MSTLAPLYTADSLKPAYKLYYSLALHARSQLPPAADWLPQLADAVQSDHIHLLEHHAPSPTTQQFLLSVQPHTSPSAAIRLIKGRLQHLLGDSHPKAFQRNYAIYSIGENARSDVESYVTRQLGHHQMADPRVQASLADYQLRFPQIDLSAERRSAHGLFKHNLHLVMVHDERWNVIEPTVLTAIRDMIVRVARKRGHLLSAAGVLCDHVHLAIGCGVDESPEDVALCYLNNLAYAQGMRANYMHGYYAGTFGNYDLGAIRNRIRRQGG